MYQLDDLLHLMARLRDPQHGCPWDLQQDFASIVPHTLEEAYEVADAIEQGDFAHLPGELGDLLFQVVYYSQLGRELALFDFAQVVHGITAKLIRRHPHVFPDGDLYGSPDVPRLGEAAIKQRTQQGFVGGQAAVHLPVTSNQFLFHDFTMSGQSCPHAAPLPSACVRQPHRLQGTNCG